jgi:hypothetical protein
MLRLELDVCGIPYAIECPDGLQYADFHALRHSFIALLDRSGATLKEAMQLARHSDPKLTMAVYGRAQLHDLGAAVQRMPALLGGQQNEVLKATGTDPGLSPVCTGFAHPNARACGDIVADDSWPTGQAGKHQSRNHLMLQGITTACESIIGREKSSGGGDRTRDTRLMKPLL